MADEPKPQQGDEAELFALHNDALMRRVARVVRTSPETIEDARSIAWAQFLRHQPDRDREWRAWLFRTAHARRGPWTRRGVGPGRSMPSQARTARRQSRWTRAISSTSAMTSRRQSTS